MTAVTFDTLKFSERLIKAGIPEAHAKAEAEALAEVLESQQGTLVTDVKLERELAPIKSDLRLLKWMIALVIITTVVPALKSIFS